MKDLLKRTAGLALVTAVLFWSGCSLEADTPTLPANTPAEQTGGESGGESGGETGGETGGEPGGESGGETGGETGGEPGGEEPNGETITGSAAVSITLWETGDGVSISVEDAEDAEIAISRGASGSLTAEVEGYTGVQWYLNGKPLEEETDGSITIEAENYNSGTYLLGVIAVKDGISYSQDIYFTITD